MAADEHPEVGLCARCVAARRIRTPRSTFWLCTRAADDSRFERYPRLPVRACPGFEPMHEGERPPEHPPGRDA
ncbi:MAG TPA: hypothetical protein VMH61_06910 [Candidatus Acidoferrales bacterium]|nr:hypothetical protein [Candidatus Acidoferrales bacterium]